MASEVTKESVESLGDALPKVMAHVRDNVIPVYQSIPTGALAVSMMRHDLDCAAKAMAEGDVVKMLAVYQSLKGYKL